MAEVKVNDNIELAIKPNIGFGIVRESVQAMIYIAIFAVVIYLPKLLGVDDLLTTTLGILNAFGLTIGKAPALKGLEGLVLISAFIYVFLAVTLKSNTVVLLEDNKVKIIQNSLVKKRKIMKYGDILRIKYDPDFLNGGKIIFETYNITKQIIVNYVNPLKETFEKSHKIINENMAKEVSNKIEAVTQGEVGENQVEKVVNLLKKEIVSKEDIMHTINELSRTTTPKNEKNIFKIVLKELAKKRKISRDDLKEIIDELKDQGIINVEDLKELTELLFETEEGFEGL